MANHHHGVADVYLGLYRCRHIPYAPLPACFLSAAVRNAMLGRLMSFRDEEKEERRGRQEVLVSVPKKAG